MIHLPNDIVGTAICDGCKTVVFPGIKDRCCVSVNFK